MSISLFIALFGICQIPILQTFGVNYLLSQNFQKETFNIQAQNIHGFFPFHLKIKEVNIQTPDLQRLGSLHNVFLKVNIASLFGPLPQLRQLSVEYLHIKNFQHLKQALQAYSNSSTSLSSTNDFCADSLQKILSGIAVVLPSLQIKRMMIENIRHSLKFEGEMSHEASPDYKILKSHLINTSSKKEVLSLKFDLTKHNALYFYVKFQDKKGEFLGERIELAECQGTHEFTQKTTHIESLQFLTPTFTFNTKGSLKVDDNLLYIHQKLNNAYFIKSIIAFEGASFKVLEINCEDMSLEDATQKKELFSIKSPQGIVYANAQFKGFVEISSSKYLAPYWPSTLKGVLCSKTDESSISLQLSSRIKDKNTVTGYVKYHFNAQKIEGSLKLPLLGIHEFVKNSTLNCNFYFLLAEQKGTLETTLDYLSILNTSVKNIQTNISINSSSLIFKTVATSQNTKELQSYIEGTYDFKQDHINIHKASISAHDVLWQLSKTLVIKNLLKSPFIKIEDFKIETFLKSKPSGELVWVSSQNKLLLTQMHLYLYTFFDPSFEVDAILNGTFKIDSKSYSLEESSLTLDQVSLNTSKKEKQDPFLRSLRWVLKTKKSPQKNVYTVDCRHYSFDTLLFQTSGHMTTSKDCSLIDSPIALTLKGNLKIGPLIKLMPIPDFIDGHLKINLLIHGTLINPSIEGDILISDGVYESFMNGTYIGNMQGKIIAKGKTLHLDVIKGEDRRVQKGAKKGTVKITGIATLNPVCLIEPNIKLHLEDLVVVRRDDMVIHSSGDIFIKGKGLQSKITGTVTLDPGIILLEELTDDDIATIIFKKNGVHEKTKKEIKTLYKKQRRLKDPLFPIDLTIQAQNNFTLRGKGVNSKWNGFLQVKGDFSVGAPYLVGTLLLNDGKISFFGKMLTLTQGKIIFDEEDENNPYVFLEGCKTLEQYKLYFQLKGKANDTESIEKTRFSFYSVPALTEDSVMSMLLFGKTSREISVGQSVQLAAAAASLNSNGGVGLNFLEGLRKAFGFDIFELKENETAAQLSDTGKTAAQSLSIGKEFDGFKIYFDQGLGNTGSKATLSKPLSHNLYVDIDVGDKLAGSGIGLNWIQRY